MGPTDIVVAHIDAVLIKVAAEEHIQSAKFHNTSEYNDKGEGYLGVIEVHEIQGENKTLSVIVKSAPRNILLREISPITECFLSEIHFYSTVVPTFNKFLKSIQISKEYDGVPKCYATTKDKFKELLVLENLKAQYYELWDRKKLFDKEHTEMVLDGYGKLHAMSLAMKHLNRNMYNKMVDGLGDSISAWFEQGKLIEACITLCERNQLLIDPVEEEPVFDAFSRMCYDIRKIVSNDDALSDPFSVVTHTDCWSNNMLFHYEVDNGLKTPSSLKLIDFQMSRTASIIYDISHFLCTCTGELIWNQLEHYLLVYYNSLTNELLKFSTNPTTVIPYNEFKDEFKSRCRYGLVVSSIYMRIMLMESEDAPDVEELEGNFAAKFTKEIKAEEVYKERMRFLIRCFHKNGFI